MRRIRRSYWPLFSVITVVTIIFTAGWYIGRGGHDLPFLENAHAEGHKESSRQFMSDPNGMVEQRFTYHPGTEKLGEDEVRVIALGTGMPAARRGQAAACFLVELGNGDKFLFDIGSGSMRNVMSLNIPADFLTKIFISHLHTDHWEIWTASGPGDGPAAGRKPLRFGAQMVHGRIWEPNMPLTGSCVPTIGTM